MSGSLSAGASLSQTKGILVYDVNAPWREKVFQALGEFLPVVGIAPSRLGSPRPPRCADTRVNLLGYQRRQIPVLPGWSRRLYWLHRPWLWQRGRQALASRGIGVKAVIVTIPHHRFLLEQIGPGIKKIYYCPDYYPGYHGWDAKWVQNQEIAIARQADAIVCVSHALGRRLCSLVPEAEDKIYISPNGTDPEFLDEGPAFAPQALPANHNSILRPYLGCVGIFNERIDYQLLLETIKHISDGTLVLVGPMAPLPTKVEEERQQLLSHPRVLTVGMQPHNSLPRWIRAMDVLLIPYRESIFNEMCSPMRLFDYLGSGRPIVATAACHQISQMKDLLYLGDKEMFLQACKTAVYESRNISHPLDRWRLAHDSLWVNRALNLFSKIIKL